MSPAPGWNARGVASLANLTWLLRLRHALLVSASPADGGGKRVIGAAYSAASSRSFSTLPMGWPHRGGDQVAFVHLVGRHGATRTDAALPSR